MQIAMKELREKKIPFTVRRFLPDKRYIPPLASRSKSSALCRNIVMRSNDNVFYSLLLLNVTQVDTAESRSSMSI